MSELNTSQREKLILIKEMIDNSLIRNENSLITQIQKLCMQLTIEERIVVRPAQGAAILLENSFFRDLLSLVKSEEFQAFYTQGFQVFTLQFLFYTLIDGHVLPSRISLHDNEVVRERGYIPQI